MGLDQFAYAKKNDEKIEIFYWRKHANLQGFMERLFRERGGDGEFNCASLTLSEDDLNLLERQYCNLPVATGFFWGDSNDSDNVRTNEFITKARHFLSEGYQIIYSSWW